MLPSKAPGTYYKPYDVATMLINYIPIKVDNGSVSINLVKVIRFLISNKHVPFGQSTIYKLRERMNLNMIESSSTWTELSKKGKKRLLSDRGFNNLIHFIKNKTSGGKAMSLSEINDEVKQRIYKEWRKRRFNVDLPSISPTTLNSYASMIKAQNTFNVYSTINNKTEARTVAEWSIRFTIAYLCVIATTHFVPNISPCRYHPKQKDLSTESVELWSHVERCYNNMTGNDSAISKLYPILPNLITSTDETTIFATSSIINNKESFYIVSRPTVTKNEHINSSCRNDYKSVLTGDAHCRGLRIVINSSFTAAGLSAPIFVAVYGMTPEEMPLDEVILVQVPGLTVAGEQDLYSCGEGYVCFVRGNFDFDNPESSNADTNTSPLVTQSKESRVAHLYRTKVYHPFINQLRIRKYGMSESLTEPPHLRAVSWMDGASGQLKLITNEENLKTEAALKITCCKHSAARTGVEQAADCGPMFKFLKSQMKQMDNPHSASNSIMHFLETEFTSLRATSTSNPTRLLNISPHKKKALLATIPNLPEATAKAYSVSNVKKGFVLNGQLDNDSKLVPCLENIVHTYRGDLNGTVLEDKGRLLDQFYEEMFSKGIIEEASFDQYNVPYDTNFEGNHVMRDMNISQENRQRSKVLSSFAQVEERKKLIYEKRMEHYRKDKDVYEKEQMMFKSNIKCENQLIQMVLKYGDTNFNVESYSSITFEMVTKYINLEICLNHKKDIKVVDIKNFVRCRSDASKRGKRYSYLNVPSLRQDLIKRLIELKHSPIKPPNYPICPVEPVALEDEGRDCNDDVDVDASEDMNE